MGDSLNKDDLMSNALDSIRSVRSLGYGRVFVSIGLVFLVLGIYGRVLGYGYVGYDDMKYIVENDRLSDGLSLENVYWSFTTTYFSNWHPLTWLSYLLDIELFGLEPQNFHRTNIFLHALNAVLLLWWLGDATKRFWPSTLVAFLFAVHPLHVESVAWISERKDVLSMFFMLVTLLVYSRYIRNPSSRAYVVIELLFVCALASKSMVVMLPIVLLLLDIWPFNRISQGMSIRDLIQEKVPLFALSCAASVLTIIAQGQGGTIVSIDEWSLGRRFLTSIASYGTYIVQTVYPVHLSVHYPRHWDTAFWVEALIGFLILFIVTGFSFWMYKRRPYFLAGWFWFLLTLVPAIGIVQVGKTAHADRYTYIPQIGLLIMGAWFIADMISVYPRLKLWLIGLCIIVVMLLSSGTYRQVEVWENSETLFRNAVVQSPDSEWSHWALGLALKKLDRHDEAFPSFDRALALNPEFPEALFSKAELLEETGRLDEAEIVALKIDTQRYGYIPADFLLGKIYMGREDYEKAIHRYEKWLELDEYDTESRVTMGIALVRTGQLEKGIATFREAIKRDSDSAFAHYQYGLALVKSNEVETGIKELKRTIEIATDHTGALEELIRLLEMTDHHDESIPYRNTLNALRNTDAEN